MHSKSPCSVLWAAFPDMRVIAGVAWAPPLPQPAVPVLDFTRGTFENFPLFLPRERSGTPSAHFDHFGSTRCSSQGLMAFSACWRIPWANTPSFPFPCFFWCLVMPRFLPDVSYFLFPHITHDSSSGRSSWESTWVPTFTYFCLFFFL